MNQRRVAVIGAGIAGLTAAHRLVAAGVHPVVFEADVQAGGRMRSVSKGDFIFDLGTIALLGGQPILTELIRSAGLEDSFAPAPPLVIAVPRNGAVKRIDSAHPLRDVLATDLLSTGSKLKLMKLGWKTLRHRKAFNCESAIGLGAFDVETITDYARRELGTEAADYLCSPLIRALWLGDAARNSVAQLLWTLKQMIYPLYTLDCGNGALADALARRFDVRYEHRVLRVEQEHEQIRVRYGTSGREAVEDFDACVMAVPPPFALGIAPEIAGAQRDFFEAACCTSMLSVHFGLSHRPANPETVLMFPECDFDDIACVYINHNKAPGRAPTGKGSLSAYFTEYWSRDHLSLSDDELIALAIERMRPYYPEVSTQVEQAFVQRWPFFVVSGTPGIYKLMERYEIWQREQPVSRLQFAGDFLPNAGINQAMASGDAAARRVLDRLT